MRSKKVKQILGIGIIVVIIAGVVFLFTRLNKPAEQEQAMQTAPKFLTEETVDAPSLVEEERTWEEVVLEDDLWLRTITDTYIFAEPFSDAKTIVKVPINTDIDELACCFQGKESMGWSKVSYNGKTGYVDMRDAEYIIEEEEEVVEVEETTEGVSEEEQHSIVEVNEPDEKADETAKADSTEKSDKAEQTTQKEQTAQTTQPAEQPKPAETAPTQPAETPNPNVTTKTEAEKQAELQNEVLQQLLSSGGVIEDGVPTGSFGGFGGSGTKYGDLQ